MCHTLSAPLFNSRNYDSLYKLYLVAYHDHAGICSRSGDVDGRAVVDRLGVLPDLVDSAKVVETSALAMVDLVDDLRPVRGPSRRQRVRDRRSLNVEPVVGSCETVVSQVVESEPVRAQVSKEKFVPVWRRTVGVKPSVDSLPSLSAGVSQSSSASVAPVDLRLELKRTYDLRRVAENLLAVRQAEVKLEGLNDVARTADLNALKKQQIIQWVNESVAKSQASLDKVKSVDPGSSISQADVRALIKENEDLKFQHEQVFDHLGKEFGLEKSAEILRIVQPLSSEEERQLVDEAQEYADNFSV